MGESPWKFESSRPHHSFKIRSSPSGTVGQRTAWRACVDPESSLDDGGVFRSIMARPLRKRMRVPLPAPAFINAIGTAVPDHDIHHAFIDWARAQIDAIRARSSCSIAWPRGRASRIAGRCSTEHPAADRRLRAAASTPARSARHRRAHGDSMPRRRPSWRWRRSTALADQTAARWHHPSRRRELHRLRRARHRPDHRPPARACRRSVERLLVGFMGCYAAVAALRTRAPYRPVASRTRACWCVCVELSTLHLQEAERDRAAAGDAPVRRRRRRGAGDQPSPHGFDDRLSHSRRLCPNSAELIRWDITDHGFAMHLSGEVPGADRRRARRSRVRRSGDSAAARRQTIDGWAVHAGGRSILDAVEHALALAPGRACRIRAACWPMTATCRRRR